MQLEQTCWRGVQVEHPADWELSRASGLGKPGKLVFSDRFYQRITVTWKSMKYLPDTEMVLKPHRLTKKGEDIEVANLQDAPEPWKGVVRGAPEHTITHAGRFYKDRRLLVEVTFAWPGERDCELEREIIASIDLQPQPQEDETRQWRASGMDLDIDRDYELQSSSTKVGRVKWTFKKDPDAKRSVVVERFAMPDTWLKGSVRDWLVRELPLGFKPIRQDFHSVNRHSGEFLVSHKKAGFIASLCGKAEVSSSTAWICPAENRLYRVTVCDVTTDIELPWPDGLEVRCCKPIPQSI